MAHDLRSLRREYALTLTEAAAGILHPISLCKIETGQCEPRALTVRKLALRYQTTTSDICRRCRVARERWLAKQARKKPAPAPVAAPADPTPPPAESGTRSLPRPRSRAARVAVSLPPVLPPVPLPLPLVPVSAESPASVPGSVPVLLPVAISEQAQRVSA